MNPKMIFVVLMIFCSYNFITAAPTQSALEGQEAMDMEKTYYELQELKRVVRQCPFSGGFGGPGGPGGPDINQLISIAGTILNALNGGNVGSAGFPQTGPGQPGIDTNQIARLMRRAG